jgi:hypothetical protein
MMLTHDSTGGVRIELTRRAQAQARVCLSAVKYEKRVLEELPCAFLREFCTG